MTQFHLAQLNIARAVDDMASETLAPFVALLDEINSLAERSPGFVWRLKDETGNATALSFDGDQRIIVNMSVWQDIAPLADFVYKSAHTGVMARRREWFEVMKQAYHVLWWIEAGTEPTLEQAQKKLNRLQSHGPSQQAFTFKAPFLKPLATLVQ